jgi:hypothetical protein
VGRDKQKQRWQVLKIDRSEAAELSVLEDPAIYTEAEIKLLLARVAEGNRPTGGLTFVTPAYGIVGTCVLIPRSRRMISTFIVGEFCVVNCKPYQVTD